MEQFEDAIRVLHRPTRAWRLSSPTATARPSPANSSGLENLARTEAVSNELPDLMCRKVSTAFGTANLTSLGGFAAPLTVWPFSGSPQHTTSPSSSKPHVWKVADADRYESVQRRSTQHAIIRPEKAPTS